jgi:hypothetical protein
LKRVPVLSKATLLSFFIF